MLEMEGYRDAPLLVRRLPRSAAATATATIAALALLSLIGKGVVAEFRQLFWRAHEVDAAAVSLGSLVAAYPLRAAAAFMLAVAAAVAAEIAPQLFRRFAVRAWVAAGLAGAFVYLLSALGVAYAPLLVAAAAAAIGATVVGTAVDVRRRPQVSSERRVRVAPAALVAPLVVGLALGVVLLRASLEVVTEWDAIVYHASFARDWVATLPGLPRAAGPSLGAELSYNYPALYPAVAVTFSKGLALGVVDVLRWLPPLAAISVIAVSRTLVPRRLGALGWIPAGLMLGSPLFVNYAQWPTVYAVSTLLAFLLAAELWLGEGSPRPVLAAALLGLLAVAGMLGLVLAAAFAAVGAAAAVARSLRNGEGVLAAVRGLLGVPRTIAIRVLLLAGPLAGVVAASLRRTHALFFPWLSWPGGAHLLPHAYWAAAQREIVTNAYSAYGTGVGAFWQPLWQILRHSLLFPGGLGALALVAVLLARGPRERALGGAVALVLVAGTGLFVAAQLVWLRYFVVLVPLLAVAAGRAVFAGSGGRVTERHASGLRTVAAGGIAAIASAGLVYGASLGLAGPNGYTYTELMPLAQGHVSAFEAASEVTNVPQRLHAVFGDDARAWSDIRRLTRAGLKVGTFDVRNFYVPYPSTVQLDGLAGSTIPRGSTKRQTIAHLQALGVQAVFIPSWVWDPSTPALVNPLAHWSPVTQWVGAAGLRAVRTYVDNRTHAYPSVLYAVGDDAGRIARVLRGTVDVSAQGGVGTTVTAGRGSLRVSDPLGPYGWFRIAAPGVENHGPVLRLRFRLGSGTGLGVYEPSTTTAFTPAVAPDCSTAPAAMRQAVLDVEFPGSPLGFAVLDVAAPKAHDLRASLSPRPNTPRPELMVASCGDPATRTGAYFATGDRYGRLAALHPTRDLALSFEYRDTGTGTVTFNAVRGARSVWIYDVAAVQRCGTGGWVHGEIPLPSYGDPVAEVAPVVTGQPFLVRNLRIVRRSPSSAFATVACGDPTSSAGGVFRHGSTASRITLTSHGAPLSVAFDYLDSGGGAVSFNVLGAGARTWTYGAASVPRCGSGRWVHGSIALPALPRGPVQIGPVVKGVDLRVRDLHTTRTAGASAPSPAEACRRTDPGRHQSKGVPAT